MDKKFKIIMQNSAQKDILTIYNYISIVLGNTAASNKLMQKIKDRFNEIATYPKSAPLLINEYVKNKNIRKLIIDNYIAFYEINEQKNEIIVLRILHCTTNYINMI